MLKRETVGEVGARVQYVRDVLRHPPFRVTVNTTVEILAAYLRKFPIDVVPVFKSVFSDNVVGVVYPQTVLLMKSRKEELKIGQVMNQPIVVKESWRVDNVVEILISEAKWGAVVVDEDGNYVGVVTLSDLLTALLTREPKAKSVAAVYTSKEEKSRVGFVPAIESVTKVLKKLTGGEVDGFVALSREGGAVGILTVWDFVKSRRWFKGAGKPRPIFGTRVARGESKATGVARVWRVMFRGVSVATLDMPIDEVARYMATTGLYVVPVVDREGRVIGAVTAWDVFHAYLYGPKPGRGDVEIKRAVELPVAKPSLEEVVRVKPVKHVTGLRARDVMLSDVPVVNVKDTYSRIRRVFLNTGSGVVAVLDENGKVVGFVSRRDLLSYIAEKSLGYWKRQKGKRLVLKEEVKPGERAKIAVREGTAGEIMKTDFPTVKESDTVEEIAYRMLTAGTDYVVVVGEDNALVGVVTKDELVKAFRERGRSVNVGELMTPIEVAKVDLFASLHSLLKRINAFELDGVVVSEGNDLKGLVTVDDLTFRPVEETLRGEKLVFFTRSGIKRVTTGLERMRYSKAGTLMALDVMKPVSHVAPINVDVREILDKLIEQDVLPVVDEQGKLVGVLNKMDIVKELARVYITYAMPEKVTVVR